MNHVIDNLYLGSLDDASNVNDRSKYSIERIISIGCDNAQENNEYVKYYKFDDKDVNDFKLELVYDILSTNPKPTLIYCSDGRSKSVAFALHYLMKKHGYTLDGALQFVREKRPSVSPLPNDLKLLSEDVNLDQMVESALEDLNEPDPSLDASFSSIEGKITILVDDDQQVQSEPLLQERTSQDSNDVDSVEATTHKLTLNSETSEASSEIALQDSNDVEVVEASTLKHPLNNETAEVPSETALQDYKDEENVENTQSHDIETAVTSSNLEEKLMDIKVAEESGESIDKPAEQVSSDEAAAPSTKISPAADDIPSKIALATERKQEGADLFKQKDFTLARYKYFEALRFLELPHDDLSNEQKAEIFELTVPCHNNIAVCCLKLKDYTECSLFASNGLKLIEALESKIDSTDGSELWKCIVARGNIISKDQLQMQWKKKSLLYLGKAETARKEYENAVTYLKAGIKLLEGDENANKQELEEFQSLFTQANNLRSKVLEKEKKMYRKSLAKFSEDQEKSDAKDNKGESPAFDRARSLQDSPKSVPEATSPAPAFTGGMPLDVKDILRGISDSEEEFSTDDDKDHSNDLYTIAFISVVAIAGVYGLCLLWRTRK